MVVAAAYEEEEDFTELLEGMLLGYERHGNDAYAYQYSTVAEAIEAYENRELYIFEKKIINKDNGKVVLLYQNGKLLNSFPHNVLCSLR